MERTIFEYEELFKDAYYDFNNQFDTIAIEKFDGRVTISNYERFAKFRAMDDDRGFIGISQKLIKKDFILILVVVRDWELEDYFIESYESQEELDKAYELAEKDQNQWK